MRETPAVRLLFPTDFSSECVRAGRAIAALAGTCRVDVSIVHVVEPGGDPAVARRALRASAPRSVGGGRCERVLIRSNDAARAVGELCKSDDFDLVIAPASDKSKVARLFTPSFRAELLRYSGLPLWTGVECLRAATLERPFSSVACVIDFDDSPRSLVRHVSAFARRFGSRINALCLVPPLHDGAIADILTSDAPLTPASALAGIQSLFAAEQMPEVDVTVLEHRHGLQRMLARWEADVLFVGTRRTSRAWSHGFSREMDTLSCPLVYVGSTSAGFTRWTFDDATPAGERVGTPAGTLAVATRA